MGFHVGFYLTPKNDINFNSVLMCGYFSPSDVVVFDAVQA